MELWPQKQNTPVINLDNVIIIITIIIIVIIISNHCVPSLYLLFAPGIIIQTCPVMNKPINSVSRDGGEQSNPRMKSLGSNNHFPLFETPP